mmetsp:Transcript_52009/g.62568  ORF Transcript_52009/g.62568 Transcript_52009/m.62568 type:complete len:277 (+) Transcript_52009:114-944(+)|eukprot:CAMPEP_0172517342 /NCGR_PEP_ID=MMETSP1066-20121228/284445_1 /TAXON_ID=671091 /ORGANISM="Coscinodiscus wailesii, Strain CCMP2513" /LENGTH=276 /DNA_ID=CAMNT_0013299303 /DNA_START=39 /DNA_END=869 /DNA_ORIENTATION=-
MPTNNYDKSNPRQQEHFIIHLNRTIPVTYDGPITIEQAKLATSAPSFQKWLQNLSSPAPNSQTHDEPSPSPSQPILLHAVHLQSIDMFGKRVGFIKLRANCTTPDGRHTLPGICLLRGSAVAVLVSLRAEETNEEYCVLTEQARVPAGKVILEIPAGMIDGPSGTFCGTAAKELKEECDIVVKEDELIDLTSMYEEGIPMSPGGCDEYIKLFYCVKTMTKNELESLQGKLTGLRDEGELITLRLVKMDTVWKTCCDAKLLCALFLVEKWKSRNGES